jgi:hypothetical protein
MGNLCNGVFNRSLKKRKCSESVEIIEEEEEYDKLYKEYLQTLKEEGVSRGKNKNENFYKIISK